LDIQQTLSEIAPLLKRGDKVPVYQQIVMQIRLRIEHGELVAGQSLPTLKQLSQLLHVGQMTVRHALEELASQNRVVTRQGSGTRIADHHFPRHSPMSRELPIHIVCADMNDGYPFLMPLVQCFKQCLAKRDGKRGDQSVKLVNLSINEDDASRLTSELDLSQSRGVLFNSPMNLTMLSMCMKRGVPYVLLFNDLADGSSPCVLVDYGPGLSSALAEMQKAGRKRAVLLTPGVDRFSAGRLAEIFRTLLGAYGFPSDPQTVVAAGYHQQQGYDATTRLLSEKQRADVIFYSSDYQALGGLEAASKRGVQVPEEVAMVGIGDLLDESDWPLRLATLDMHMDQFCQMALDALLDEQSSGIRRHVVQSTFVPGQTC